MNQSDHSSPVRKRNRTNPTENPMRLLAVLKFVLVLSLLAIGTAFLLKGVGFEIPLLKFKGMGAHNVPAGIAILLIGIALARLWKIHTTRTVTEKTTTVFADGSSTSATRTTKSEAQFMPSNKRP